MNTIYDVDYFIRKFEAIPEELICVGTIGHPEEPRCANGHCYRGFMDVTEEIRGLYKVFSALRNRLTPTTDARWSLSYINHTGQQDYSRIAEQINNGNTAEYQQPTPKARILAALRDIKAKQQPKEIVKVMVVDDKPLPERIVYVTVDKQVRELQKAELPLS